MFVLTADVTSFSTQVSPFEKSYPATAMRSRAVTPAVYQLEPVLATHFVHAAKLNSAMAWKLGPSARMSAAAFGRGFVLSATSGGTEM